MGRPKKALKVKEPIRLRERKLANGNLGLYLDIYVKGTRKYESLGLYLIPEKGSPLGCSGMVSALSTPSTSKTSAFIFVKS